MPHKRRSFKRPLGERRYRKMFVIATEGVMTEPQYFALLNDLHTVIHVTCLKDKNNSSPPQVLKRMTIYLKEQDLIQTATTLLARIGHTTSERPCTGWFRISSKSAKPQPPPSAKRMLTL